MVAARGRLPERQVRQEPAPAAVSLAWLLAQPQVTSAIFGARSVAQLGENVTAAALTLSAEQLKRLNEASAFELGYP